MPEYRRLFIPGGTYFFTVVTAGRAKILVSERAVALLRSCFRATQERWPFRVAAMVVLPDHLHAIWILPDGDANYSRRWAFLKKEFTKQWLDSGGHEQETSESRRRNRRRGIWQRRFWEHAIRDETDFRRHCDYIHYNPVKHGVTECPHEWAYSSFLRFVTDGVYDEDWCCACRGVTPRAPRFTTVASTVGE